MSNQTNASDRFKSFMHEPRVLLDCYSENMDVHLYMKLDPATQRDFCYGPRVSIEDKLIRGKISATDFFKAA